MSDSSVPESEILNAAGFRVHVDRWRGGRKTHVMLLHGLGGNKITWYGVAPVLAEQLGAHVVALDLPGFGSTRPERRRINLRVLSDVIVDVMNAEAAHDAEWLLAGNSLGGLLALELACRFPGRVRAVNLAAPALPLGWGREGPWYAGFWRYIPLAVPWQGRRLVSRYVKARGVPGVVDDPVRLLFRDPARLDAALREQLIEVSKDRLTWADEAARAYEQTTRSLGLELLLPGLAGRWIRRVRCPVQAIYGSHDPLFPSAAWQALARARPDWHYVSMDDIGHVPQLEAPREFAGHLLAWLGQLGQPSAAPARDLDGSLGDPELVGAS